MAGEQDRDMERREVPQHLREAADQVGALLVEQVGSIIGAAETRAQEIRGGAEQDQERIREETQTAAATVVQRIELIENELSGMLQGLQGLREEASRLAEGLVLTAGDRPAELPVSDTPGASAPASGFTAPTPPAEPDPPAAEVVEDEPPAAEAAAEAPPAAPPQPATEAETREEPAEASREPGRPDEPEPKDESPSWSQLAEELAADAPEEEEPPPATRADEEGSAPGDELMRSIDAPPAGSESSWAPPDPSEPSAPPGQPGPEQPPGAVDQPPGPEAPVYPPSGGFAPPRRRRRGLFRRRRDP